MSVEVRRMTKCLVAVRALVGRGGAVSCLMLLQVGLLAKPFLAHYTLERSLACEKKMFCYGMSCYIETRKYEIDLSIFLNYCIIYIE